MKKLFLVIFALLLVAGIANAAGIPTAADPKNAPEIWTQEVYNNSTSILYSGFVCEWDMDADTTDANYAYRTAWVTLPAGDDAIRTAGVVVDDSIPASGQGTISIYGPTYVKAADSSDALTAGQVVGSYSTGGMCGAYTTGTDTGYLGWCILAAPVDDAYGGYTTDGSTSDGRNGEMYPIFINIGIEG